eukprot:Pgem_evm1s4362
MVSQIDIHRNFRLAWLNGDVNALFSMMDKDVVIKTAKGEYLEGLEQVQRRFQRDKHQMKDIFDYSEPYILDPVKSRSHLKARYMLMTFNLEEVLFINDQGKIIAMSR